MLRELSYPAVLILFLTASQVHLVSELTEGLAWDKAKGELSVLGRRHVAVDAESLCQHLDALVGVQVAEVIMNNHQIRLGKEDAARARQERPQATVREIVDLLVDADSLSGMGMTKVSLPESPENAIAIQISNPAVRATVGSAKGFVFSYWAAVLSFLLARELEVGDVTYNERDNTLSCQIVLRLNK